MAKKPKSKTVISLRSAPVSFRLDFSLIEQIQTVADVLGVKRNRLVALVLREYLVERNSEALRDLAKEADPIDLFA